MSEHIADLASRKELRLLTEKEVRKLVDKYEFVDADFDFSHYVPSGPVTKDFILSQALTAVLMGPLGGGKTTGCVFKRIYAATLAPIAIHPSDKKRTRMCRWIVLRDTFRSVEKTVLESWKQWFPKDYPGSSWTGGNDRPVTHTLRFIGVDGVIVEAITEFAGLGDSDVETMMKGREYSGVWLNELDTHVAGAIDDAEQRVGRYPRQGILEDADAERMRFVIGDLNAPTMDNWVYPGFVTERPAGRAFFQQPSGTSPMAENRFNLPRDYYDRILENQEDHFIRRMVHNEFGYSRKGKPVHPSFDHKRHVAEAPIAFDRNFDLHVGIDISTNALTPAAVLGQNIGRIKIIDEIVPEQGFGPKRFAELLKQTLNENYPTAQRVRLWLDPASQFGGDNEGGQLAAIDMISTILGLAVEVPFGGSNELSLRLTAVDQELRGWLEPNTSLLISPTCPILIAAMGGKYRFKKLSNQATNDYADLPEKSHPASDICDGTQYLIGGIRGRTAVIRGEGNQSKGSGWSSSRAGSGGARFGGGGFDPRTTGL